MRIVFSDHSIERLKQRNITELQVYTTVKSSEDIIKSYRERTVYRRKFGNKILEVITKHEGKDLIIISAYMIK